MSDKEEAELERMKRKRLWIHRTVGVLVAITLAPLLCAFMRGLLWENIPWIRGDVRQAGLLVGFVIVVMAAVTLCCILLLRIREYPPEEEHSSPSLIPGVVILAIGALVVLVSVVQ
jgi:predicted neutral ceramidase superfamily lipid hydrolase